MPRRKQSPLPQTPATTAPKTNHVRHFNSQTSNPESFAPNQRDHPITNTLGGCAFWLPRTERDQLSEYAHSVDSSMRCIVQDWLRPHLRRALAGKSTSDIPSDVVVSQQRPYWVKPRVELSLREYQAVRLAVAKANASRNRLLYAWVKPHLEEVTRNAS